MSLGFDAISALPFATSGPDNNVTFAVTGNALTVSIGPVNIQADAVVEEVTGNPLTLGTGTLSITGTANVSPIGETLAVPVIDNVPVPSVNGLPVTSSTTASA